MIYCRIRRKVKDEGLPGARLLHLLSRLPRPGTVPEVLRHRRMGGHRRIPLPRAPLLLLHQQLHVPDDRPPLGPLPRHHRTAPAPRRSPGDAALDDSSRGVPDLCPLRLHTRSRRLADSRSRRPDIRRPRGIRVPRELQRLEHDGAQRFPDRDHTRLHRHPEHRDHARGRLGRAVDGAAETRRVSPGLPDDLYPEHSAQRLRHHGIQRAVVPLPPRDRRQRRVRVREFLLGA